MGCTKQLFQWIIKTNSLQASWLSHSALLYNSADNAFTKRPGKLDVRRTISSSQRASSIGLTSLLNATARRRNCTVREQKDHRTHSYPYQKSRKRSQLPLNRCLSSSISNNCLSIPRVSSRSTSERLRTGLITIPEEAHVYIQARQDDSRCLGSPSHNLYAIGFRPFPCQARSGTHFRGVSARS
jgi:hypothetical protein